MQSLDRIEIAFVQILNLQMHVNLEFMPVHVLVSCVKLEVECIKLHVECVCPRMASVVETEGSVFICHSQPNTTLYS